MKYKKYLMGFLFVFSILFTTIVGTSNVLADTTSYSGAYNYDNTGNKQYRFITIVKVNTMDWKSLCFRTTNKRYLSKKWRYVIL